MYCVCIVCSGQTGAGKTFTSFGPDDALAGQIITAADIPQSAGIVLRACVQLLEAKSMLQRQQGILVSFTGQFVEIYDEKVICGAVI